MGEKERERRAEKEGWMRLREIKMGEKNGGGKERMERGRGTEENKGR